MSEVIQKRKRGRPRKGEIVSLRAFAEMCGIEKKHLYNYTVMDPPQVIYTVDGSGVDIKNIVNASFLQSRQRKISKKKQLDELDAEVRIENADVMKKESDARWKAVQTRKVLNELIDKRMVEKVFLLLGRTIRELLLPQGERVSPKICALFESVDRDKIMAVSEMVDDENGRVLDEFKRVMKEEIEKEKMFETFDDD